MVSKAGDDDELTRLALQEPPPDDYVPSETTSGDSQSRRLAMMMPVGSAIIFLVTTGLFVVLVGTMLRKGPFVASVHCGPAGCRSPLVAAVVSGVMALLSLGVFIGSVTRTGRDR